MKNSLVSIIVPVYNVEKYLEKCIKSLINQTYKNIEIIIINDGSKDSSKDICLKYKEIDNRIVYIEKENGGLSSARNKGLEIFKGEYVGFVDSDDYVDEFFVEKLLNLIVDNDCDIVCCDFNRSSLGKLQVQNDEYFIYDTYKDGILNDILIDKINAQVCNKLYKRNLYQDIFFPLKKTYEDLFVTHLVYSKTRKVCFSKLKLYYYNDENESSISHDIKKVLYNKLCIAEAFVERYYFAKSNSLSIQEEGLKIATKQVTDTYRVYKNENILDDISNGLIDFILKNIKNIIFSYKIDIVKKYYATEMYFKYKR